MIDALRLGTTKPLIDFRKQAESFSHMFARVPYLCTTCSESISDRSDVDPVRVHNLDSVKTHR